MKRALTGIASVGILAVTVGVETANAQPYRRYVVKEHAMPRRHRRGPNPDRHRSLELLAASRDGCTEATRPGNVARPDAA